MAEKAGVTVKTLLAWRKFEAIDITDKAAVLTRAAVAKRKEPANPAPSPADGESYSEARRRRAVADADKAEVIARRESGSVIEVAAVEELMTQLGAEMRSRLLGWRGDLVVELEGLSGPKIAAVLDRRICELLERIHRNSPIKSKP